MTTTAEKDVPAIAAGAGAGRRRRGSRTETDTYRLFLHRAHVFAATMREIVEEEYLGQATALDLSVAQYSLLRLIANSGQHQVGEIAAFLGVSQAAASKTVEKLVRLDLVTRGVQETDRRAVSLNLTHKGKGVIQRYEALKERKLSDVLARMEAHELDALISGLGKVTLLIADKEAARTRCMRCSSYYARPCMLESRCGRCAYLQVRTASGAIGLPAVDLPGPG